LFVPGLLTISDRLTATEPDGLPLEVSLFVNDTSWASRKQIKSDMFDHVYGILPLFELHIWQMR
jgi:miniconductance mechanosensitive channel